MPSNQRKRRAPVRRARSAAADHRLIPRSVLYSLFMQAPAPVCVLRGSDHVFDLVNPMYQRLVGGRDVLGKPAREALPELEGQGYFELLDQVFATGEPFLGKEARVMLDRSGDGTIDDGFFNFVYQPMHNGGTQVEGIMVFGFEVTDQVLARRQASQLTEELRAANREKDEFVAVISHELRTPMTSILGWTRLLRLGELDAATYNDALESIERSTKAQAKLIEDLLDESRITSGKLRLEMRPVDLTVLLEEAVAMVMPSAEARRIDLVSEISTERFEATADPLRLQQVISNVLSNAIKFTPEDGRVRVRLERSGTVAVLEVVDNGRGIAPDLLPRIFDRFHQGEMQSERQSGLGLGLSIARHLIEIHGGSIEAASDGQGKGATFTIRLPLNVAAVSANRFVGRDQPGRTRALPRLDGVRVLIVEDELDNRNMIAAVMERCGAEVDCSTTAADAFLRIKRGKPDVLICDIALPDLDGCKFLSQLRESGSDTPALALTVFGRPDEQARIISCGFSVFRQKPVEPADLANDVARLAGR